MQYLKDNKCVIEQNLNTLLLRQKKNIQMNKFAFIQTLHISRNKNEKPTNNRIQVHCSKAHIYIQKPI